jgi:hypothetical protein
VVVIHSLNARSGSYEAFEGTPRGPDFERTSATDLGEETELGEGQEAGAGGRAGAGDGCICYSLWLF